MYHGGTLGLYDTVLLQLYVSFETGKFEFSNFVLPFKDCFGYSGPLHFYMYFRISLSIATKEPSGILVEIVLNLEINLEITAILAILSWQTHDEKSIYLSLHQFVFTIHCSFQCTSFKLLSDLFLSILFFSMLS